MRFIIAIAVFFSVGCWQLTAQHTLRIHATLDTQNHAVDIQQQLIYANSSKVPLDTLYLTDWANSFSSKTTPLAAQFAYHFKSNFHFQKDEFRGRTDLHSVTYNNSQLTWQRGKEADILYVLLPKTLQPGDSISLHFEYRVKIPEDKFTRFGFSKNENYKLRYWFIAPAVFDEKWQVYSNKNLDDFYMPPTHFFIQFSFPEIYRLTSDLNQQSLSIQNGLKTVFLSGENYTAATLYLFKENPFEIIFTDRMEVHTSIKSKDLAAPLQAVCVDRILDFLEERLGPYPFEKMVVSYEDYRNNPAYGLNQLPDFIRPFPNGFQYDLESFKTIAGNYLKNTLLLNPRHEHWLRDGLQIYLLMEYTDTYYPDMKIFGNLSQVIGLRWFHASSLNFNDQYELLYRNAALLNLDQPVSTPRDSLIKYNAEIAAAYKTAVGLRHLNNYLGNDIVNKSIALWYAQSAGTLQKASLFEKIVRQQTNKNVDWFFDTYVHTQEKIDYRIKNIKRKNDSLYVTIENKRSNKIPFTLLTLQRKTPISEYWIDGFTGDSILVFPTQNTDRFAIDYRQEIPDINKRNNYRKVKGLFKKPLQFRLLQDIEDPRYTQFFFMPVFEYNYYDGLTIGTKLYNKTLLPKNFTYRIEPMYGLRSETLIGGGNVIYSHPIENSKLYNLRAGVSGKYFSYDYDLFYRRIIAFGTASFRNQDLRSNKRQFINLRHVYVEKDFDARADWQEPNYNVLNTQYVYTDANLLRHFRFQMDYEVAADFQKITSTVEYRRLYLNNRQINLRMFAGTFLKNNSYKNSDYFSFSLDRPTDYMFDYNYYGRSESSGLFSQQLILAEGGFKSKMETPYANNWMLTFNAGTNIWRWIHLYGDIGLVNNRNSGTDFFYDSGIRISLVDDYFELYFPLQSSLGWEPSLNRYDQRIRFIVTLQPETLIGLFTRRWY